MIDTDMLMARYLWVKEQMKTYSLDEALHLVMPVLTRKKMLELLDKIPEMLDEISDMRKRLMDENPFYDSRGKSHDADAE